MHVPFSPFTLYEFTGGEWGRGVAGAALVTSIVVKLCVWSVVKAVFPVVVVTFVSGILDVPLLSGSTDVTSALHSSANIEIYIIEQLTCRRSNQCKLFIGKKKFQCNDIHRKIRHLLSNKLILESHVIL